jgi:hypothetical protein
LLAHLTERLGEGESGQRKVFRDSAIANLSEFFSRFDQLNVRSHPDLDRLVAQAQELVQGVKPQDLRDNDGLRRLIASEMAGVQASVERLIVDAPRRRIIRPQANGDGGNHAAAG